MRIFINNDGFIQADMNDGSIVLLARNKFDHELHRVAAYIGDVWDFAYGTQWEMLKLFNGLTS